MKAIYLTTIKIVETIFVYQKALIRIFFTSKKPLWIHNTRIQIQKGFCTKKTGCNVYFKIPGTQNKSDSDLVRKIQLISI